MTTLGTPRNHRVTKGTRSARDLGTAMAQFQAATVVLDRVDPITTELVRLRCAEHHDCHL